MMLSVAETYGGESESIIDDLPIRPQNEPRTRFRHETPVLLKFSLAI